MKKGRPSRAERDRVQIILSPLPAGENHWRTKEKRRENSFKTRNGWKEEIRGRLILGVFWELNVQEAQRCQSSRNGGKRSVERGTDA